MFGNIGEMMKLQKQFKDIQKRIKKAEHNGESGDTSVKVTVNGEFELVSISIDDELVKNGDRKKIEKNVQMAVNNAVEKGKSFAAAQMKELTGGLPIPGLSDLF
ncbi:MAG TPA: YbaB/EbfC family nucleoid-associated protein [Spirochaetota bacterium]